MAFFLTPPPSSPLSWSSCKSQRLVLCHLFQPLGRIQHHDNSLVLKPLSSFLWHQFVCFSSYPPGPSSFFLVPSLLFPNGAEPRALFLTISFFSSSWVTSSSSFICLWLANKHLQGKYLPWTPGVAIQPLTWQMWHTAETEIWILPYPKFAPQLGFLIFVNDTINHLAAQAKIESLCLNHLLPSYLTSNPSVYSIDAA